MLTFDRLTSKACHCCVNLLNAQSFKLIYLSVSYSFAGILYDVLNT